MIQEPLWKNNSRILGRAAEIYSYENIKCVNCNELNWFECVTNEKSKDLVCKTCGQKYQIKCKNTTEKSYDNIKKNNIFKTVGAEYNTTLKSIDYQIDYIIILYEKVEKSILDIIHIKSSNITSDNIIPRNPLSDNARRAGWQGCNLHFTNFDFIK
tara:strand:+ start:818 stop:1285 length:468 start_codon:yes stop_codon:yes gene_type:complete